MKKNNYKFIIGVLALLLLVSCTDSFEDINTNDFELTPEMGKADGIAVGGPITAMQKIVVPIGTQADGTDIVNEYQLAYNLAGDVWSGYFGQNNNWGGGSNNTTYFLMEDWISRSYRSAYSDLLPLWKEVKIESEKANTPEVFALAQIIKISAWHKATDMFGPIPYKKAGEPILVVPYDSQEDVYKGFFEELESAIEIIAEKAGQGARILPDFDAVYGGDTHKWIKYANSLMLRLAMRVRYADPQLAQTYAEKAVNHPVGVMMNKDDEAKMSVGAGLVFVNNIEFLAGQYGECRMGSSMFSYLAGYDDPRLSTYFKTSDSDYAIEVSNQGKFQAVPTGHTYGHNEYFKSYSMPNIEKSTPTYWMRASEIYFLRAEGALLGWSMNGQAEDLYKEGVKTSFVENNIDASKSSSYLSSEAKPIKYQDPGFGFSAPAPTEVTAAWEGSDETKLEKIITQKWIALYPNGQEAWSEWRRTGYPKLHKVRTNRSGGVVSTDEGIRRMRYPIASRQSEDEIENIEKAILLLGGEDNASTKLWWDKKNHY